MRMIYNLFLYYDLYKDMEVCCCDDSGGLVVENYVFYDFDFLRVGVLIYVCVSWWYDVIL